MSSQPGIAWFFYGYLVLNGLVRLINVLAGDRSGSLPWPVEVTLWSASVLAGLWGMGTLWRSRSRDDRPA